MTHVHAPIAPKKSDNCGICRCGALFRKIDGQWRLW